MQLNSVKKTGKQLFDLVTEIIHDLDKSVFSGVLGRALHPSELRRE